MPKITKEDFIRYIELYIKETRAVYKLNDEFGIDLLADDWFVGSGIMFDFIRKDFDIPEENYMFENFVHDIIFEKDMSYWDTAPWGRDLDKLYDYLADKGWEKE